MYVAPSAKRFRRRTRIETLNAQVAALQEQLRRSLILQVSLYRAVKDYANEENWGEDTAGKRYWLGEGNGPELAMQLLKKLSGEKETAIECSNESSAQTVES